MPSPHPASQSELGRVESQARGHHFFSRFFRRLVSPAVRGLLVWGSGARAGGAGSACAPGCGRVQGAPVRSRSVCLLALRCCVPSRP